MMPSSSLPSISRLEIHWALVIVQVSAKALFFLWATMVSWFLPKFASLLVLAVANLGLVMYGFKAVASLRSAQCLRVPEVRIAGAGLLVTVLFDIGLVGMLLWDFKRCVPSDTNACGIILLPAAFLIGSCAASVLPAAICSKAWVDFILRQRENGCDAESLV